MAVVSGMWPRSGQIGYVSAGVRLRGARRPSWLILGGQRDVS